MKNWQHMKNGNFFIGIGIVVMVILFISSSQTYEQQSAVPLLGKLLKDEPLRQAFAGISFSYGGSPVSIKESGYVHFVEFFIRKGAHFGTYFVMGASFFCGLSRKLKCRALPAFFGWLAATGYAGLDEFHQMLTGGRTPLFEDVVLDSVGALSACLILVMYLSIRRKSHW